MKIIRLENGLVKLIIKNRATLTDENDLAEIQISDPSMPEISSNNLLAYRPRYADLHKSNLAALFINLEGVFPCLTSTGYTGQSATPSQKKKMDLEMEEY